MTEASAPAAAQTVLMSLVRADLRGHAVYEPIVPVDVLAAQLGLRPEQIVKLDGNENLYGPSPRVREALSEHDGLNIYPDPEQRAVRAALAGYTGVSEEHIVAGAGSDELIDLVARALLSPGDAVVDLTPTFGMYAFTASVCGARLIRVPRRADFSIDTAAVAAALDERAKIIFVASPNNPSGNVITEEELSALLRLPVAVVLDEAYIEFSGGSHVRLVPERENLIVLRTFSKWAGLAGVRAGYGVMPPMLARLLMAIKPPYNISVPAERAVLASLADRESLLINVASIVTERERLFGHLQAVDYLEPRPSVANFILCRVTRGSARNLRDRLRERGVFLRYFGSAGLEDCIRISVGRPEDSDALLEALATVQP